MSRILGSFNLGASSDRTRGARLLFAIGLVVLTVSLAVPTSVRGQDDEEAAQATGPAGVYTVTITREDLPVGLPGGPTLIGQWSLSLEEDGTYELGRQDVGVVAAGTYDVEGATLTLTEERGLLPCVTGVDSEGESLAEASYAWEVEDEVLTLTSIEEGCVDRRVLLTTRTLGGFEACSTAPLVLPGRDDGQPDATPNPTVDAVTTAARAIAQDEEGDADVAAAIDDLLRQATGCWAAGDPARFLALHSGEVLDRLNAAVTLAEVQSQLAPAMQQPLSFERVGEIDSPDATHATAYIEIQIGGEAIPLRFEFVLEDGEWLLNSFFLEELANVNN